MTVSSITPLVPHAIAALALILAFFFVVRPIMRQMEMKEVEEEAVEVAEEVRENDDHLASRLHSLVNEYQPIDSGDLNKLVANQPNLAAQVIKVEPNRLGFTHGCYRPTTHYIDRPTTRPTTGLGTRHVPRPRRVAKLTGILKSGRVARYRSRHGGRGERLARGH